MIPARLTAIGERKAVEIERLRRVRQLNTAQDYLIRFKKAAAECPDLLQEEKTNEFVTSPRPESGGLVYERRPRNMKEAIKEADD